MPPCRLRSSRIRGARRRGAGPFGSRPHLFESAYPRPSSQVAGCLRDGVQQGNHHANVADHESEGLGSRNLDRSILHHHRHRPHLYVEAVSPLWTRSTPVDRSAGGPPLPPARPDLREMDRCGFSRSDFRRVSHCRPLFVRLESGPPETVATRVRPAGPAPYTTRPPAGAALAGPFFHRMRKPPSRPDTWRPRGDAKRGTTDCLPVMPLSSSRSRPSHDPGAVSPHADGTHRDRSHRPTVGAVAVSGRRLSCVRCGPLSCVSCRSRPRSRRRRVRCRSASWRPGRSGVGSSGCRWPGSSAETRRHRPGRRSGRRRAAASPPA